MAHQSLYRRYRSQNFAEIKGQSHVTTALRTAVAEGRHSHAYLFSGPRGTGKTSTARVLAKALNCENLVDGEPDGTCKSCLDIQNGTSFDLHELDAASNNKVDDVRDLIAKVALGSPGRTKVYILDEVHMLSSGAENALLKTLEEPPEHVVFVLATTEPHKVVPTIRSRTQHFEFKLLPGDDLEAHLRYVIDDAGLDVDDDGIAYALRQGGGSARDTLSALDLVAAAGGVPEGSDIGVELAMAIGDADAPATIAAVERAIEGGREPRVIAENAVETLRHAFLSSMGAPLNQLSEQARGQASEVASALGPATITRALEMLGQSLIEMRQAPDPRVPLEVALLRLSRNDGSDTAGLLQRIETLEAKVASLTANPSAPATPAPTADAPSPDAATPTPADPAAPPRPHSQPTESQPPPPTRPSGPAQAARATLQDRERAATTPKPAPAAPPEAAQAAPVAPAATHAAGAAVSLDQVEAALGSGLLDAVSQRARVRFAAARPLSVGDDNLVTFAVPNDYYLPRCQDVQDEIESALADRFQRSVRVALVVDAKQTSPHNSAGAVVTAPAPPAEQPPADEADEIGDIHELDDASDVASTSIERITKAFPGSQVIDSFDQFPN